MLVESDFPSVPGYALLASLGVGGTASVYLAENQLGEKVAVKVLHQHLAVIPEVRKLLAKEAKTLQKVNGNGVARILEVNVGQELSYLVMEFVQGETLDALVAKKPLSGLFLSNTLLGIVDSIASIHAAGVVHRDLKPSNVVLGPEGVTVLDFGLSILEEVASVTRPQDIGGTPAWISPEQINGGKIGPESDIFNFGMLIAFLATGRNPFGEGKPEALLYRIANSEPELQQLDPNLRRLVAACLVKNPNNRPKLEEIRAALLGADLGFDIDSPSAEDRTQLASRTTIERVFQDSEPSNREAKPKRSLLMISGIAGGLALILGIVLDLYVFEYGDDVVFRYLNSSAQNQPISGAEVAIEIDGEKQVISLPDSSVPKELSQQVGRWDLDSTVDVVVTPSFTQDKPISLTRSAADLRLSRFHSGRDLVIEVELTDEKTIVRVGFGSSSPMSDALEEQSGSRSNEAKIVAEAEAEERRYLEEQRALYSECVSSVQSGWTSELGPLFALEANYAGLRDSYFDGTTREIEDWAYRAYGLSEAMFAQFLGANSPARTTSSYAPYSANLVEDAGFLFETHSYLSDSWNSLGDALLYYPNYSGGFLQDLYPRQYMFINQFEDQLQTAANALKSTIGSDSKLYCQLEYPDSK